MRNRFSTLLLLLSCLPFLAFGQGVPELMYYKFDGGGTTVLNQASSPVGTNPAPVEGTLLTQGGAGQFGQGLVGTGSPNANRVNTGWAPNLGNGAWTISFYTSNVPTDGTLNYIMGDGGTASWRVFDDGIAGPGNWMMRGPITDVTITGGATGLPHVMHYVYDPVAGEIRGYLDGVLNTTVAQPTLNITGTGPFTVGGTSAGATGLAGILDEFRMYNRALSQAEITTTWNQTLPLIVSAIDIAATGISSPTGAANACFGANETVTANIANFGQNALDFSSSNVQVTVTATGPNPQTFTTTLNSGTLASGAFMPVTLSTAYDMSAGGTYSFDVSVAFLTGGPDGNPANNSLPSPVQVTNTAIVVSGSTFLENYDTWGTRLVATFNGWTTTPGTSSAGLNWESEVDRPGQSSPGTGPLSDHTTPNTPGTGSYIFLETSVGTQGDDAEFESPCIDLTNATCPTLSFWYHMFGADIGTLFTEVNDGSGWVTLDQIVGQQQSGQASDYLKREVSLGGSIGQVVRVRFRATKGGASFNGDISIDDFEISDSAPIADIGVNSFLSPVNLGQCFGSETISIEIQNKGCTVIDLAVDPVRLTTTVTGANPQVFTNDFTTGTLAPGDVQLVTVTTSYNMAGNGTYTFNAASSLINGGNDGNPGNDNAPELAITNFAEVVTLGTPYLEDFDSFSGNSGATSANQNGWVSVPGASSTGLTWESDFNGGNSGGTGPLQDHTNPGTGRYVFMETSAGTAGDDAEYESPCIDLTQAVCPELSFWYHMFGAAMGDMAIEVLSGNTWIQVDFIQGQPNPQAAQNSPWLLREIKLGQFAGQVVRVRFRGIRGTTFTSDMAIDDVMMIDTPPFDDIGVTALVSPVLGSCFTNAEDVIVEIGNFGCTTIDFAANNGRVTVDVTGTNPSTLTADITAGTLAPGDLMTVLVSSSFDLTVNGMYTINATTSFPNSGPDGNPSNDALDPPVDINVNSGLVITPGAGYFEDFDSGPGGWVSGGTSSTWALGTPAKSVINSASSDPNAWVTGGLGTGTYGTDESSWVQSPGIDFSAPGLSEQRLELDVWWNAENSFDGANVQYSTDGGGSWNLIGALNNPVADDAVNWYTDGTISGQPGGSQIGWTGRTSTGNGSGGWVTAGINLPPVFAGNCGVLFRVFFGSDGSVQDNGFAFDNFRLYELPPIDISMVEVTGSFATGGCNLTNAETVTITFEQKGTMDLLAGTSIPVSFP